MCYGSRSLQYQIVYKLGLEQMKLRGTPLVVLLHILLLVMLIGMKYYYYDFHARQQLYIRV